MSSVHYKFRSLLSYKTLNFDALHISADELKQRIYEAEGLNPEACILIVESTHSKKEFSGNDLIPRNYSLIVKRLPRHDGIKMPKIHDTSTSGIIPALSTEEPSDYGLAPKIDYFKMSEEQRLEHIKQISYQKYHPTNYQRKSRYMMTSDAPPPGYVCNRCNRPGHWVKQCPMGNMKKTTGIPIEDLIPTTADDPYAMLHPSGRLMAHKMHADARRNSKVKAPVPFLINLDRKSK